MKKHKRSLIGLTSLILMLTLSACGSSITKADMSAYEGFKEDHHFKTSNYSDVLEMIETKQQGIYLIANPENPTSLNYVEILDDFATEKELDIMVIDTSSKKYNDGIRNRVQVLEETNIADKDLRNVYPIIYIADKDNLNAVYPVFNNVNVSSRRLNLEEQEETLEAIQMLWYE